MILGFVHNREAIRQRRGFANVQFAVIGNQQKKQGIRAVIDINASDTVPFVGMVLLEGFELRVQAYEGGSVAILPIS